MAAVPSLDWARAQETGSWDHKEQTPTRDRWLNLNSSWTLSARWTLNRPRGTSLEGLSGWIQTVWRAARAQCRARAHRGSVLKTTAAGDSDGSHKDAVPTRPPSQHGPRRHQWTSRQDRPPAAPQRPLARPAPPRAQNLKVRPSLGPGTHARGPGMASTTPRPTR